MSSLLDTVFRRSNPPLREISGYGLRLVPWDAERLAEMGRWGERGFPYHAFDLGYLRDPERVKSMLGWAKEHNEHRHFVALEDGVAVGRISVNLSDESGLYLWSIHVPPEHEGRGVARRMMAALMTWLEVTVPGRDFILATNGFAEHAHRAYYATGFTILETRWVVDDHIARMLWKVEKERRRPVLDYMRFAGRQWQVQQHLMTRKAGTPMNVTFEAKT